MGGLSSLRPYLMMWVIFSPRSMCKYFRCHSRWRILCLRVTAVDSRGAVNLWAPTRNKDMVDYGLWINDRSSMRVDRCYLARWCFINSPRSLRRRQTLLCVLAWALSYLRQNKPNRQPRSPRRQGVERYQQQKKPAEDIKKETRPNHTEGYANNRRNEASNSKFPMD